MRASLQARIGTAALLLALAAPAFAQDPCPSCVSDKAAHPMTALAKPALGQVAIDPQFGTKIRRITAVNVAEGENAIIKPMYATMQAWNADESKLILWHRGVGHELYDGRTYAYIRQLPIGPTDIEQVLWDPVDPDVLYYPSGYNALPIFKRYRVSTNTVEDFHDFGNAPTSCPRGNWGILLQLGRDPQYMSWGPSRIVALQCGNLKFSYDLAAKQVLGQRTIAINNAPIVGATGTRAFLSTEVLDPLSATLATLLTLPMNNGGGSPDSAQHAGLGKSAATGHDEYHHVAFDGGAGGDANTGTIVTWDLVTGTRKVVVGPGVCDQGLGASRSAAAPARVTRKRDPATGKPVRSGGPSALAAGQCYPYPPSGTHISAIAHKTAGGWVAASIVGDPGGSCVLCQEVILANTDTGKVYRVGHHRSQGPEGGNFGYWAEPHLVLSPTGTRILFGSDWGNGPSVDSYVIELPGYGGPSPSPSPAAACSNGLDDDGDGLIDFPADPGCSTGLDDDEFNPPPSPSPSPSTSPSPSPSPSSSPPPAVTFSLALSPASITVPPGTTGTSTLTLTSSGGFAGAVSFSVAAPLSISPPSVTLAAGGIATATVSVPIPPGTPPGTTGSATVTALSGSIRKTAVLTATVGSPAPTPTPTPPPPPGCNSHSWLCRWFGYGCCP